MLKNTPPEASWVDRRSGFRVRGSPLYGYPRTLQLKPRRGPTAAVCLISEAMGWIFHSLYDSEQWNSGLWSPILFMEPLFLCLINHCHFEFLQCLTKSTYVDLSVGLKLLQWRCMAILSPETGTVPHRLSNSKPQQGQWGQEQLHQPPPWLVYPRCHHRHPLFGALSAELRGLKIKFLLGQAGA